MHINPNETIIYYFLLSVIANERTHSQRITGAPSTTTLSSPNPSSLSEISNDHDIILPSLAGINSRVNLLFRRLKYDYLLLSKRAAKISRKENRHANEVCYSVLSCLRDRFTRVIIAWSATRSLAPPCRYDMRGQPAHTNFLSVLAQILG